VAQVVGKRGGPANSGRRECTAVGASLSQPSEIGAPDSVTSSEAGTVLTESGSRLGSEGDLIETLRTDGESRSLARAYTMSLEVTPPSKTDTKYTKTATCEQAAVLEAF
jgi:hypothetical protein